MLLWLQLLICLATIGYAGYFFSRYGDIIAEEPACLPLGLVSSCCRLLPHYPSW